MPLIAQSVINAASDLEKICMAAYATGQYSPPSGLYWYSKPTDVTSNWYRDMIWYLLNDAWGEQPSGAMPHNVYAFLVPALEVASGLTYTPPESETPENYLLSYRSFFDAGLWAISNAAA